jgi:hypothetical protein
MASGRSNAVIGQSGGPTAVINQSLVGVVQGLRAGGFAGRVLGICHAISSLEARVDSATRPAARKRRSRHIEGSRHEDSPNRTVSARNQGAHAPLLTSQDARCGNGTLTAFIRVHITGRHPGRGRGHPFALRPDGAFATDGCGRARSLPPNLTSEGTVA